MKLKFESKEDFKRALDTIWDMCRTPEQIDYANWIQKKYDGGAMEFRMINTKKGWMLFDNKNYEDNIRIPE